MIALGRWTGDPRITRVTDTGAAAGGDCIVQVADHVVAIRDGIHTQHSTVDDALAHLLTEPMPHLVRGLIDTFPDPEVRHDMRLHCLRLGGPHGPWPALAAALAASLHPTGPVT